MIYWDYFDNCRKVLGFISSYISHKGEVKTENSSDDKKMFYEKNSGMAVAYRSDLINELITNL